MANLVSLQWHITNKCNNRCKHCYINNYSLGEVNKDTAIKILADFKSFSEKLNAEAVLALSGGDPLLSKNFWLILKKAKKFCSRLAVLGNPELLTTEVIKRLHEIGIDEYQLSLDGMKKTHDYIRYKGSFNNTVISIKKLLAAGIEVAVMSTVSYLNYLEILDVMRFAYSLGIKHWTFSRWVPENGDCGITPDEYRKFLLAILSEHKKFNFFTNFKPKDPLYAILLSKPEQKEKKIVSGCSLGFSKLVMLPDSTIMACRRHPESKLGKWSKNNGFLKKFLFHEKMNTFRKINEIENCGNCKFLYHCRGCRACSFAASGNILAKDPQCWL